MKKAAILLGLLLCGCEAITPITYANHKMTQSQEAYRDCLVANPGKPAECETQRALYELDLQALRATGAAVP